MRSMRNHRAKPASNKPTKMPINSSICTNFKNLVQRYMFRAQRYCTRKEKIRAGDAIALKCKEKYSALLRGAGNELPPKCDSGLTDEEG